VNRRFRLKGTSSFQRVRRLGKSYAHPLLVLVALKTGGPDCKIAVAAGRAIGGAVERNRVKRLVRAALQPFLQSLLPGHALIIINRRPMAAATFQETHRALQILLDRAHVLRATIDEQVEVHNPFPPAP
jgi:ribonuclease P protein component